MGVLHSPGARHGRRSALRRKPLWVAVCLSAQDHCSTSCAPCFYDRNKVPQSQVRCSNSRIWQALDCRVWTSEHPMLRPMWTCAERQAGTQPNCRDHQVCKAGSVRLCGRSGLHQSQPIWRAIWWSREVPTPLAHIERRQSGEGSEKAM